MILLLDMEKDGSVRSEEFKKKQVELINKFCADNNLPIFEVTADKSPRFTHFVDDKAIKVIENMGIIINVRNGL